MDDGGSRISPEINSTFEKLATSAKKAGFRDGAAEGQSRIFQKSFDEGYREGFRNGFALGKYKGTIRLSESADRLPEASLEHSKRAGCRVCADQSLLNASVEVIKQKQADYSNDLLRKLHSVHSPVSPATTPQNT